MSQNFTDVLYGVGKQVGAPTIQKSVCMSLQSFMLSRFHMPLSNLASLLFLRHCLFLPVTLRSITLKFNALQIEVSYQNNSFVSPTVLSRSGLHSPDRSYSTYL